MDATQVQAEQVQVEAVQPDIEKITSEIEARVKAEFESKTKAEIAGLNRKVSEYEKAKLSEAEKFALDRKELEADRALLVKEQRNLTVESLLSSADLPKTFAKSISGESAEEIGKAVSELKTLIATEAARQSEAEVTKRLGGNAPTGGTTELAGSWQASYDMAIKARDIPSQIAIQRQALEAGETLKT